MNYAQAKSNQEERDKLYQYYVTDALKVIAGNTAGLHKESRVMKDRFYDLVEPKQKEEKTDPRSGEEITKDVISVISKTAGKR